MIGENGRIVGIDIDIREHNRAEIEQHPMFKNIDLIEGSSIDPQIAEHIYKLAANKQKVLVILDSNHTHDHVLAELNLYYWKYQFYQRYPLLLYQYLKPFQQH